MNIAPIAIKTSWTDFAFLQSAAILQTLNRRISSSICSLSIAFLSILQLLHAFREPFDKLAEFIGNLRVLSGQLAMLVPSGLSILPVWQIKLLESVQCISRILDLVSDFCDAFIDSVSLDGVLLVT